MSTSVPERVATDGFVGLLAFVDNARLVTNSVHDDGAAYAHAPTCAGAQPKAVTHRKMPGYCG